VFEDDGSEIFVEDMERNVVNTIHKKTVISERVSHTAILDRIKVSFG